jgi:fused signal recognition particle receptor
MGIRATVDSLRKGLEKTRQGIFWKLGEFLGSKSANDEELFEHMEEALIGADVGMNTTQEILDATSLALRQRKSRHPDEIIAILKEEIGRLVDLEKSQQNLQSDESAPPKPFVILVVGVNGSGKTTTIGKLAHLYRMQGKKVVIAAADTFRAAADEQLQVWAERAQASLVRQNEGSDPAAVAFDAVRAAVARGADVVIIDTAGRLHTRVNLMEELRKIRRVIQKVDMHMPHEVYLVIDASTGQNGLQQARHFSAAVGVSGLILTKLDGTAKGGIVLAILRELKIPVRFVGMGEGLEDLQPFDATTFVDAMISP